MGSPRFLIVQTGRAIGSVRSRLGDFPHWFRVAMGLPQHAVDIVDVQSGAALPTIGAPASHAADEASRASNRADEASYHGYAGVIVTGSNAMVSDREPWSEATAAWIRRTHDAGVPMLGVCYGHQLIAHAFGGRVDYHPQGREMGTHLVERLDAARGDALFHPVPARFSAQLTHRQSVLEAPEGAVVLARSAHDPVQAFRLGDRTWGVQFHPEFSTAAMRGYIAARRDDLVREDTCPRTLAQRVHAAPHARAVLRRFARLAGAASERR
jgi:GMP synthase (glutamine-hydrolysing)